MPLSALAPARRRLVVGVLALATAAVLVVAFLIVRSMRSSEVTPVAQDRPGPVLLVPGYGGSLTSLDALAANLRAAGRDVTLVSLPDSGTGDLNEQARALGSAVTSALKRTNAKSVDVIGYSAGGVVARLWVKDDGGARLTRRLITLGSPQHGTTVAGIAADLTPTQCPTACQQLAPDSSLLDQLNAGDETPRGPAYVSFWTTDDQVVTPPDSAALHGAVNIPLQNVCAGIRLAHGDLPTSPVMLAAIRLEIGAGPVVPLGPSDCERLRS